MPTERNEVSTIENGWRASRVLLWPMPVDGGSSIQKRSSNTDGKANYEEGIKSERTCTITRSVTTKRTAVESLKRRKHIRGHIQRLDVNAIETGARNTPIEHEHTTKRAAQIEKPECAVPTCPTRRSMDSFGSGGWSIALCASTVRTPLALTFFMSNMLSRLQKEESTQYRTFVNPVLGAITAKVQNSCIRFASTAKGF